MIKRIDSKSIKDVYKNIKEALLRTPMEYSPFLSEISGANVFLKLEHLQHTGSFKIRGLLSKIDSLQTIDLQRTFVTASTGNHASAFVYASQIHRFCGKIFMPMSVCPEKLAPLQSNNINIEIYGRNSCETEEYATKYSLETDSILIHPYNDIEIIKGQGTIGIEIEEQVSEVETVLAPVGGGGLISGLCSYFHNTKVKVIGCQPENASEMYDSIKLGKIVNPSSLSTISDATAGGIEANSLTFEICRQKLHRIDLVGEKEIKDAISIMIKHHHTIIEPGAALPVAALLRGKKFEGQKVVLVLTGKKIRHSLLTEIINSNGNSN